MLAGILRDKIDIYTVTKTDNTYSEQKKSYQKSFSDRAETSFAGGAERQTGQMGVVERSMNFKVRFNPHRYNETMVVLWRGDYYNIRSIDPDRQRQYLILRTERAATGTIKITIPTPPAP
jgi:SPP1 family predicted phage head-tail adaptor